jgi:PKD repeat protein
MIKVGLTTHEIGHWLGLFHISGDEECGDDECNDTPPQRGNEGDGQGLNYGCPTFPHLPNSCSGTGANGELFMNFMDYTDDACMYLFTPDQRTRMQTAMSTISLRTSLGNSTACNTTPQAPVANFTANRTSVCPGNTVTFTDLSTNNPTSWSWSFPGGTPATVTGTNAASRNPTVTYNSAGTYSVTLTATNAQGSDGETKTGYISVGNPTGSALPFFEGFQNATFPPTGWVRNSTSTFNWERTTAAGGFGTSNASMFFNNYVNNAASNKDDIVSPIINLNGANTPRLKFDVAYAPYVNNSGISKFDTLEVLITDFCANTTTSIYKKGGIQLATAPTNANAFIPNSSQWRKDSVFIPAAYLNKNVKITFRNYGLYANNIYVDNINLYGITTSTCTGTPTANFTSSATSVCAGNSITFTNTSTVTAGTIDSVRWIIQGGSPATSISKTTVTPLFNTPGNYTVTLNAYKCGTLSTKSQAITIKANPTVAALTGPSAVCTGATITLSSTTPGGVWSSSVPDMASVNTSGVVTGLMNGSTEIIYTVSNNGCSTSVIKFITVNTTPNVTVTSPAICSGKTAQPIAGGATTYSWTGGLAAVSNPTTPILTTTTTYTVTGTTGTCSKTAVATVTVNALPNVTVTSPTICSGKTAQPIAGGATSYNWTGGLASISNPTTPVLTTTTTYTVTGTTGTCSKTAVATVTVNPLPNVTVSSPGICTASSVTLQASGASAYSWTGGLAAISNPSTPVLTTTTTYTVTGTTGACSKTAVATVTVSSSLNVTVNSPSICSGSTASLLANGASSYSWTGGLTGVSNPTTPVLTTTTTYTVTGTSGACSKTAIATVTVKPIPGTPSITQSNDTLYSSVIIAGATYDWYKSGVLQSTTTTPFYKFTSNGAYTLKIVNNDCSSALSANLNAVLTSIKNNKLNVELSVIPNPNNGVFDITIVSAFNKTYLLKLFNLSGQVLVEEDMTVRMGQNSKQINLFGIEKGVYFLTILGDEGIATQNIIVQ